MATVVYADGPDGPLPDPAVLESVLGRPVSVTLGWVVRSPDWLDSSPAPVATLMVGTGLRRAVATGRVRDAPTRLSAVAGLLAGRLRPDLAVVGAAEVHGAWRLVGSAGWAAAAASVAGDVVIERWPTTDAPPALGPPLPPCRILEVIERAEPPDPPPQVRVAAEHESIGRLVAGLVPEGATVQWGPGSVGAAVVAQISRPVRVRSGLVTDELVGLAERGLLAAPAESAYLWGGPDLHAMVATGTLVLRETSFTHDMTALSRLERFVAVNTALQVGLDGAANVEVTGGRVISGPGGHPDFAAGASASPGGLSMVALTSTSNGRSNIVVRPEVVSTARSDVDVVVTEHGVADLRGCSTSERANRIIQIAAPQYRSELASRATAV